MDTMGKLQLCCAQAFDVGREAHESSVCCELWTGISDVLILGK